MASSDLYEMRFEWPHREPRTVIVTGTFDHWSCSTKLIKTDSGFVGSVRVPWAEKIKYKFIVDGQWLTQAGQPTEMDPGGYINNIYLTPPKPLAPAPEPIKLSRDATYGFASVQTESVKATDEKEEATPVPAPEPEKPVEVVEETPAPKIEEEKAVEKSGASERRISMPIVPVNAVEHNTIHSTPPPPPIPDYVLPPPPRARSTSPTPVRRVKPIEAQEAPVPAPEKPVEIVQPIPTPAKVEEKPVEKSRASERRMSIPIIPVNAVEHNTIHSTPPPPPVPDYVLPPPPRARSTSPPPLQEIKQAAVVPSPEPEPAKLHEVEAEGTEEPIIPTAPEVPIEEQKQEIIAHIPVDDLEVKPEFEEDAKKEEEQLPVVPTPEPAKVEASKTEEVKPPSPAPAKEEDKTTLPTPPATPHSKEFPLSSPSATPTGSPSSSRFGTAASKKKRRSSFFGKIKDLFHSDKDKEKVKK